MLSQVSIGLLLIFVGVIALFLGVKFAIQSQRFRPWREIILPAFFAPILIICGIGLGMSGLGMWFSHSTLTWDWSLLYGIPIVALFGIASVIQALFHRAVVKPLANHTVMSKWDRKPNDKSHG